tara:strand:+ start:576 stop:1616 length:1041 start_codon:yes stop_codon:yes gene_type:complete
MSNKAYLKLKISLKRSPKKWLITGVAGFIGSNILRELLDLNQTVVGLDNFSTGHKRNLEEIKKNISVDKWKNFNFIEGDITDFNICKRSTKNIDFTLHQAALGSVPRSIKDPINTNKSNIEGFLNMIYASKESKVKRFLYAASSSTYGDHKALPKKENIIGNPLSPYAVTKRVNEMYADVFGKVYGLNSVGLRYFNVFGPSQDPNGAYAAVVPKWIDAMHKGKAIYINGDGKTSRDFCYIKNVIQANLLASTCKKTISTNQVYNIAVGEKTSLNRLFKLIQKEFLISDSRFKKVTPFYRDFREGDIMHSLADISKARKHFNYQPSYKIAEGIQETVAWYLSTKRKN